MAPMSELVIEYCVVCNYYPRAVNLAESLEKRCGIGAKLVKSQGGAFEVSWGNGLLFSKKKLGRFPVPGEVEEVLARLLG